MNSQKTLLTIALLSLLCGAVRAQKTLHVPLNYPTIQAAINAARDKDTVLVAPGKFPEGTIDVTGKAITVRSAAGPLHTRLEQPNGETRVTLSGGRDTVFEGFTLIGFIQTRNDPTIRNNHILGTYSASRYVDPAIYVQGGSPLIVGNVITDHQYWDDLSLPNAAGILSLKGSPDIIGNLIARNATWHNAEFRNGLVSGSGICLADGGRIIGNTIVENLALCTGDPTFSAEVRSQGAGIFARGDILIANNIVAHNRASSEGINSKARYVSEGGGIWADARVTLVNNTVYRNSTSVDYGNLARGGGVFGGKSLVNSIIRNNTATTGPEIYANTKVSYSNIKGGYTGTGNIDKDPDFVNPAADDFHLKVTSPCRDVGTSTTPGIQKTDFEGDPRVAGGKADMGADEFHDHLYVTGKLETPGGRADIKVVGMPGRPVLWAFSPTPTVLNPPLSIPGVGFFYLNPPYNPVSLGTIPASGVLVLSIPLTSKLPQPVRIPMQALVGTKLTNLYIVDVK